MSDRLPAHPVATTQRKQTQRIQTRSREFVGELFALVSTTTSPSLPQPTTHGAAALTWSGEQRLEVDRSAGPFAAEEIRVRNKRAAPRLRGHLDDRCSPPRRAEGREAQGAHVCVCGGGVSATVRGSANV